VNVSTMMSCLEEEEDFVSCVVVNARGDMVNEI
jgi:hypothetical protein